MSEPCASLIRGLLTSSTRRRFGYKECQKHSFFSSTLGELEGFEEEEGEDTSIDFATVRSLPPPFLPELDDEDDTSYFDVRWEGNDRDAKVKAEIESLIARAEKAASPQAGIGGKEFATADTKAAFTVGTSSALRVTASAESIMEKALGVASPVASKKAALEEHNLSSSPSSAPGSERDASSVAAGAEGSETQQSTLTGNARETFTPLSTKNSALGTDTGAMGRKLPRSITGDDDDAEVVGVDGEASEFASRLKRVRKSIRHSLEDLRRGSNVAASEGRRAEFDELISAHLQKQRLRKAKARRPMKLMRKTAGSGKDDRDVGENMAGSPGSSKSSGNLPLYWKGRKRSATADNASAMSAAAAAAAGSAIGVMEVSPAQGGLLLSPVQLPLRSTSPTSNLNSASSKLDDSSSNLILDTPSPPVLSMPLRSHSAMPLSRSLGSNLRTSISPVANGTGSGVGAASSNTRDTSPHTPLPSSILSSAKKSSSERGRPVTSASIDIRRLKTPAADAKAASYRTSGGSGGDMAFLRSSSGEDGDSVRKATALFRAFSFDNFDALAELNRQAVAREQQRQEELFEEEMLEREEEEEEEEEEENEGEFNRNDIYEEEMV